MCDKPSPFVPLPEEGGLREFWGDTPQFPANPDISGLDSPFSVGARHASPLPEQARRIGLA